VVTGIIYAWVAILAAVALVWLSRHIQMSRAAQAVPALKSTDEAPADERPAVSVIVAAKDEEQNIRRCVESWLRQDWPDYEVIIVDDRSSDRTPEILAEVKNNHPAGEKLKVLRVEHLPADWAGKNNAMRVGVDTARGQWLLFSDADCHIKSQRTITVALGYAIRHRVEFLSILPQLETGSLWENIIQPVAGAVMMLWFNPIKVNDPHSDAAYANGAFMLIHRDAYRKIGGHEAVKAELNEDLHMARLAKKAGIRLCVARNEDLYTTRMYRGFKETWRGWSRIFYGCFGTVRQLMISAAFLCVMSLLPWISALVSLPVVGVKAAASPAWKAVATASLAAVAAQLSLLARFYRASRISLRYLPTWPIGAALCVGMLGSAMAKALGIQGTTWRGRTYRKRNIVRQG